MSRWAVLGLALVIVGAVGAAPGVLFLGAVLVLLGWLGRFWTTHGLRNVRYERVLGRDRAVAGDTIPLAISTWNAKLLPLAWLRVEDAASDGTVIREIPSIPHQASGLVTIPSLWTLGSYEQVIRHVTIEARRRGMYHLGPATLEVADLLGREAASGTVETEQGWLVRPRTVPVRFGATDAAPIGFHRTRVGLHEDPSLFAGVRPFQRGDPRSRMHWRATARTGEAVSRRYEPATLRQVVIALDVQTIEGPHWQMVFEDELLESLMVAAASVARYVVGEGGACGLAAVGWTGRSMRLAWLPPGTGQARLAAISDTLARMSAFASAPFQALLEELPSRLEPGTSVAILSARDPAPSLAAEAGLRRSGFPVTHLAMGGDAERWAVTARRAGVDAYVAELRGGWEQANALDLAG